MIASLPTLRKNSGDRHQRMFDAEPWDLVLVDEAHHLNADEHTGTTLGYNLMSQLMHDYKKIKSAVFFTGTPHRGKHYQFFALLKLLREDLFNPLDAVKSFDNLQSQMQNLRLVMLRNNKQFVTDMKGEKLFLPPKISSETYSYSPEEFYNKLTEFILTGKAYASGLNQINQRAVMLILVCMQKLASSSVAAIRSAIKKRLAKITNNRKELQINKDRKIWLEQFIAFDDDENIQGDELSQLEEKIFDLEDKLYLMEDEQPRLEELLEISKSVISETKINKILKIIETSFTDRQVLFFTEYKATQNLLMSALIARFGSKCVTFINGDERAEDIIEANGKVTTRVEKRSSAAEKFNSGEVKFLVSTEAGGEGIDLQENCYSLIHVDLPWNPMRLHQRVGRLNRYGQKYSVEVISLRNPDTVETRIWDKLNGKIENIMHSLEQVMEEPEDLLQLILGMASPTLFREIFSEGQQNKEQLSQWFDSKTATFGGQDAVEAVKKLVGSCEKFDFQQVSPLLPQVDLPDLQPFFEAMLQFNKKRITRTDKELSFLTPESWLTVPAIRKRYEQLHFDRNSQNKMKTSNLLGVGHCLINQALKQALDFNKCVCQVYFIEDAIAIFQIIDRVTGTQVNVCQVMVGVKLGLRSDNQKQLLKDWELLKILNKSLEKIDKIPKLEPPDINANEILSLLKESEDYLKNNLEILDLPFQYPKIQVNALLFPAYSNPT